MKPAEFARTIGVAPAAAAEVGEVRRISPEEVPLVPEQVAKAREGLETIAASLKVPRLRFLMEMGKLEAARKEILKKVDRVL